MRPLEYNEMDKSLWSDKCDYLELDGMTDLNPNGYNFVVLQLNIRGLLLNQANLCTLLNTLKSKESQVDMILLCETHLNRFTTQLVHIPRYTLISSNRSLSKGGGTSILIRSEIPHVRRVDLEKFYEKELESTYIEITAKNGKQIILGSLYGSPITDVKQLFNHLEETIPKVKQEKGSKELMLGMDHNLNLLKVHLHQQTQNFLDILLELNMLPTITRPSRITQ